MVELLKSFPDFIEAFGDKRIDRRARQVLQTLTQGRNSSIRQITSSDAEQKSFYRLFNNESFSEEKINESIVNCCGKICSGRHLLCIQDSTEFNLSGQAGRVKDNTGLGKTTKDGILGFMMHSSIVIDANKGSALGYSYIKVWDRKAETPDRHERKYQQLPIAQKESYKWIEASEKSKELLSQAQTITIIADRESDIYDLIAAVPDAKTHLLIRSNSDRKIAGGGTLTQHLNKKQEKYHYDLKVRGDVRKNIEKRTATMELKWSKVSLLKPDSCNDKGLPTHKVMYVVEAKEQNKKGGIYWRILTTHTVESNEEAMQIIEWYKQRWYIEQVHRLLKTDGFKIERTQLEQGWAIRKLTLLAMMAVLRILQMMLAYEDDNEQEVEEVFKPEEQQCLEMINEQVQGKTEKLKNPAKPQTLKWATWIIARLGGWKGYTSSRKPGPIIFQKGLIKFYHMYQGWILFKNNQILVSSQ
ncbi:MAG: IS4 family transposase [Segetibacter sp.]